MIIDPGRDGCTIWEGDKVQYLKGTPKECINLIVKTLKKRYEVIDIEEARDIDFNIALDITSIGVYYKDTFEHYGIKIHEIRPGKII